MPPIAPFHRSRFRLAAPAILALLLGACSGDGPAAPAVSASVGLRFPVPADTLLVGQQRSLGTILVDHRGRAVDPARVTWSSSEPAAVVVTQGGVAVAIAPGTAQVSAVSGSLSASMMLVVRPVPVAAITFEAVSAEILVGSSVTLRAVARDSAASALPGRRVRYSVSDSSVATISSDGTLTALAAGQVTVTAECDGVRATVRMTVAVVPVAEVVITPSSISLEPGSSARLSVAIRDARGQLLEPRPVSFRSTDGRIVTVDELGVVRGIAAGSAAIVAAVDGVTMSAIVNVYASPEPEPEVPSAPTPPSPVTAPPITDVGADGSFSITTRFIGTTDVAAEAVVAGAIARWTRAITGDLEDMLVDIPANACLAGQPASRETVDDLLIYVTVKDIDGYGKVLARAGPCFLRVRSGLPVVGVIELDAADMGRDLGTVLDVITHEMGHVLGIGTLWPLRGLVHDGVGDGPLFLGETAQLAYSGYGAGGSLVPVEGGGGVGTRGGHWRESVFRNELMTGWIGAGGNPLSRVTIASLRDLGYRIDLTAAEPYTLSVMSGLNTRLERGTGVELHDELLHPRYSVDEVGRTRRLP